MDIWINKCINEERTTSFQDSLIFNIGVPGCGGVVASDIRTGWHNLLGYTKVPEVCEDLFIIALSVFAVDKMSTSVKISGCMDTYGTRKHSGSGD